MLTSASFKKLITLSLFTMLCACSNYPDVTLQDSITHGDYHITEIEIEGSTENNRLGNPVVTEEELDITRAHLQEKLPKAFEPHRSGRDVTLNIMLNSVSMHKNSAQTLLIGDSLYINSKATLLDSTTKKPLLNTNIYVRGQSAGGITGMIVDAFISDESEFDKLTTQYTTRILETLYPSER